MMVKANFLRIAVLLLILPQHFCLVRIKMYCVRLSANTYLFFIEKKKIERERDGKNKRKKCTVKTLF